MSAGTGTGGTKRRESSILRWPEKALGPAPGLKEINLACWTLLAAFLVIQFGVPLWIQFRTGVQTLHLLPADFIYFYGIGRIANEFPLPHLYDYNLQLKVFNQIFPLQDGAYGPSPYPPFVALFFSLFARLPFNLAFAAWAASSLGLYLAGIGGALRGVYPNQRLKSSLVYCFAIGFYPFFAGTLENGQLSSVAVFAVGLAVAFERRAQLLLSGLVLSLLLYKPTLVLMLIPMLLFTRRFRQLAGFSIGASILVSISTAFGGFEVWPAYARFLQLFGRVASSSGRAGLPLWKFVDLASCVQAIFGGGSQILSIALYVLAIALFGILVIFWWRSRTAGSAAQSLAWAAAVTWTLLLNIYVPIYDSTLAVIGVVLTLAALKDLGWSEAQSRIVFLSVLIQIASWFTSGVAMEHRIQILSVALAVLGAAQLLILGRVLSPASPPGTLPAAHDAV